MHGRTVEKKHFKDLKQDAAEPGDLRHYKAAPSALVLPELDEHQDPALLLAQLSTEDLYLRAKAVPIAGAELQTRAELLQSLLAYQRWTLQAADRRES